VNWEIVEAPDPGSSSQGPGRKKVLEKPQLVAIKDQPKITNQT
jgi:hypothetical protein